MCIRDSSLIVPTAPPSPAMIQAKTSTTQVLTAVPASESIFLIPHFDRIAVIPANRAEPNACLLYTSINRLEEEGDRLYLDSMRTLHTGTTDPVEIIVWRDIFKYLEDCIDACEHTSDIVETVIMKNT